MAKAALSPDRFQAFEADVRANAFFAPGTVIACTRHGVGEHLVRTNIPTMPIVAARKNTAHPTAAVGAKPMMVWQRRLSAVM